MKHKFTQLSVGSKGTDVFILQSFLHSMHFTGKDGKSIEIDGEYGSNTAYAVTHFQQFCIYCGRSIGTADGICGAKTWKQILGE